MSLDLTKPVQTRDGRKARILCTDLNNLNWTLVAAVKEADGRETVHFYKENGSNNVTGMCLENVPERHSVWMNEYKKEKGHPFGGIRSSRSLCDDVCLTATERTAVIEIVYEDSKFVKAIRHAV